MTATRFKWLQLIGWLMVLGLMVLSLIKIPVTNMGMPNSDKGLHLFSYCFITYWFCHTYEHKKTVITSGFLSMGIGLEWLQSLTPHRYFEWLDMLMNIIGVLLAVGIFYCLKVRLKFTAT